MILVNISCLFYGISKEPSFAVALVAGFVCGPIAYVPFVDGFTTLDFRFKLLIFCILLVLYYTPAILVPRVKLPNDSAPPQFTKRAKATAVAYGGINLICGITYLAIYLIKTW